MVKRDIKNKKIMSNLKCYFIIFNLVISIIAFSGMVSGMVSGMSDPEPPSTTGTPTTDKSKEDSGKTSDAAQGSTPDASPAGFFGSFTNMNAQKLIMKVGLGATLGGIIGPIAGGEDGATWGALAGAVGGLVWQVSDNFLYGIGAAAAVFIFTYKKASKEVTEFYCLPWQAPIGGGDCELCNDFEECSEYTCKSLGQACDLVNKGTEEQRCVWVNPRDVNSPKIDFKEVSKNHVFSPDKSIRPPATGVIIRPEAQDCVKPFFPLEFKFTTNEPAQCKIDYNLTESFEDMAFYLNGNTLFKYNHTEQLSLPGPDSINAENPEIKNDGKYRLFVRCRDANGNFNQDAYSVSFCVDPGPDTTPPVVVNVNIPTGNPIQYNQSDFNLEVYVNEPSECKWSREDRGYENMEHAMDCDKNIFQMNNQNVYTCRTTLTGLQDRKDNDYYFRCKDKPFAEEGDRNVNTQSYKYTLIGTQPLNILSSGPKDTIRGATDVVPVFLEISTDNGYENGDALCYYYNDETNSQPSDESDYILFSDTKSNKHKQRQDLVSGNYKYYFKCVDLGGNAAYSSTEFKVEADRSPPKVVRAYRETDLKITTDENAQCGYSSDDCNFEVESGIEMTSLDGKIHLAEWTLNKNYYVRCKDDYGNQPFPNTCSIVVRPSEIKEPETTLEFGF